MMKITKNSEPQWAGEHLLSEANGYLSVEEIELTTGVFYPPGSVVVKAAADTKWRAIAAADLGGAEADSDGVVATSLTFGVLYHPADGVGALQVFGTAHVRDAELAAVKLNWFEDATDEQIADGESLLALQNLIARR